MAQIEAGLIQSVIEKVMPMQDAEQEHALVESDGTFGKVILSLG
jgi:NADPH:quinone reductase-like Zn-dependent oxidoreductase